MKGGGGKLVYGAAIGVVVSLLYIKSGDSSKPLLYGFFLPEAIVYVGLSIVT